MYPLIGIPCHSGVEAESHRPIFYNNIAYIRAVELEACSKPRGKQIHPINEMLTVNAR
jgi:hypothetical protein